MQVVWHDHKFVEDDLGEMVWYRYPRLAGEITERARNQGTEFDTTEDRAPFVCADRDKVEVRPRIVAVVQSNRPPVFCGIYFHVKIPPRRLSEAWRGRSTSSSALRVEGWRIHAKR